MKTVKIIRFFFAITIVWGVSGCDNFLSHEPDNRTQINTAEKISELLVSAYPEANYMTFCEAMTDNVSDRPGGFADNTNTDPFFFRDVSDKEQDSPEFYWAACYAAIAATNQALESIREAKDPSVYDAQKGEALVARAYAHFMLATLFAKPYSETADADPGIPYVLEPEKNALKLYDRHTVAYVYDQIENDLLAGIDLIDDKVYDVPSYHFTKAAAHAFAVRFYLFKGEFDKVETHANLVFPDNDFASRLRPWNTTYQILAPDVLEANYTKATEKANLLLCETSSLWARTYNRFKYATGINELNAAREVSGVVNGDFAYTVYFYSGIETYFVLKFREHFVREDISANTGLPYTIIPLFTVEEVLLSRAEARIYLNKTSSALSDLNTFLSTRIAGYDANANKLTGKKAANFYGLDEDTQIGLALLYTVLDLRRAEFLHEGLRWFDILRYGISVTHQTEGQVLTLEQDDLRKQLQIPPEAVSLAGLETNPR